MTDLRDAARQALEALESLFTLQVDYARPKQCGDAITALRAALEQPEPRNQCGETCERAKLCAICARGLEQPEQEPVAWTPSHIMDRQFYPPRREWRGLTEKEHEKARHVCRHVGVEGLVLWLEDKLKERNA